MRTLGLCLLAGVFSCMFMGCHTPQVEIIAHRGASYLAPENTMTSFMLAWQKHADAELDIYLSKDNRIMVIHDATTKRTSGVDLKVSESTSEQLRRLDVGHLKGVQFAGERIPYLSEVVHSIPPGRRLFVEIKCGPEVLPKLNEVLSQSGKRKRIVIIGFGLETVTQAKKLMPDIPVYWLVGAKKDPKTHKWIAYDPQLVRTAQEHGLDGLDVHYGGVDRSFMAAVKKAGQKLYVWTVDDPAEARRLVRLGVAGITTNRPEWLRKQLYH